MHVVSAKLEAIPGFAFSEGMFCGICVVPMKALRGTVHSQDTLDQVALCVNLDPKNAGSGWGGRIGQGIVSRKCWELLATKLDEWLVITEWTIMDHHGISWKVTCWADWTIMDHPRRDERDTKTIENWAWWGGIWWDSRKYSRIIISEIGINHSLMAFNNK